MIKQRFFYLLYFILISSILVLNQKISLTITDYMLPSQNIIWFARLALFSIVLILFCNKILIKIDVDYFKKISLLIVIYGLTDTINSWNFYQFFVILVKNCWLLTNIFLIIYIGSIINNQEKKYFIFCCSLIFWGALEIISVLFNGGETDSLGTVNFIIVPAYFALGVTLFFYKNKFLLITLGTLFCIIYFYEMNRSAVLCFLFVMLSFCSPYRILKKNYVMFMSLVITFVYTILAAYVEADAEMQSSFNTGRAQIWEFWIQKVFLDVKSALFGLGTPNVGNLESIIDLGNYENGISWLGQFHSGFIATLVTGGVFKISTLIYLVYLLLGNFNRDRFSVSIYYYSLVMITFNSMTPFFVPDLNNFIFLSSLLYPLPEKLHFKS